ncbi:restriction endonuclease subunit S [Streptomyces sp. NPDC050508]|uniref:restriction endonuclease subunit S n=1 Tax=Streptomyces sp. NPDC050508 TaxID=3155405 RepID=UPI00343C4F64
MESQAWTGVRMLGLGCLTVDGFQPRQLKNAPSASFARHEAVLCDGDLLVSRANTRDLVGLAGIFRDVGVPCIYPDLMMRLRTSDLYLPEFLELVLRSPETRRRIVALAQGTSESMVKISGSVIRRLRVPAVPISEQRRIVEVIDAVSVQESSIQAAVDKMRQLRSGLLDQAFCETMDRWSLVAIGDLCHVGSGATPSRAAGSRYFADAGTPWVKSLDLNEGSLSVTDEALTDVAMSELRMRLFPARSVLVAMYGGWEQIGRTAILEVPAAVNQAISVLEMHADMDPYYLLLALQHGRYRWRQFAASTRKDPNITKSDVLAFGIPFPPREEQERIVDLATASLREIAADEEELTKMRNLKRGLLSGLLADAI